jgi:hypothetical protein
LPTLRPGPHPLSRPSERAGGRCHDRGYASPSARCPARKSCAQSSSADSSSSSTRWNAASPIVPSARSATRRGRWASVAARRRHREDDQRDDAREVQPLGQHPDAERRAELNRHCGRHIEDEREYDASQGDHWDVLKAERPLSTDDQRCDAAHTALPGMRPLPGSVSRSARRRPLPDGRSLSPR